MINHNIVSNDYSQNHFEQNIPPAVLVMRRISIRDFGNGKKVAMYYVDKLNQYISIPYEDHKWANDNLHKENINSEKIFNFYNSLNEENKNDFISILESDFDKAMEIVRECT